MKGSPLQLEQVPTSGREKPHGHTAKQLMHDRQVNDKQSYDKSLHKNKYGNCGPATFILTNFYAGKLFELL